MKNLIFGFTLMILLSSFSSKNESPLVRSWWKTVLVDAAGALGGAGSVASISAGLSTTNPVGWGWMAAGAVVGGAGASLAMVVPPGTVPAFESLPESFTYANNSANNDDNVGNEHNDIIIGFINSKSTFTVENYINYIKSLDNDNYNKALGEIDKDYLESEFSRVAKISDESAALDLIRSRLPSGVNKVTFIQDLTVAINSKTSRDFITEVKRLEEKYVANSSLTRNEEIILNSFFSTLRFSSALWMK